MRKEVEAAIKARDAFMRCSKDSPEYAGVCETLVGALLELTKEERDAVTKEITDTISPERKAEIDRHARAAVEVIAKEMFPEKVRHRSGLN